MILRFLRCFAVFRRLEEDLADSRAQLEELSLRLTETEANADIADGQLRESLDAVSRLEDDLTEARTTVGIERELRLRADAEAQRMSTAYEEAYRGQIEAMKMLANISVQVHIGCKPPYPEVFSLPARAPKPVSYEPIETGRVNPNEAVSKANEQFYADVIEFFNPKQSAS